MTRLLLRANACLNPLQTGMLPCLEQVEVQSRSTVALTPISCPHRKWKATIYLPQQTCYLHLLLLKMRVGHMVNTFLLSFPLPPVTTTRYPDQCLQAANLSTNNSRLY
jgi:hypothetical protein